MNKETLIEKLLTEKAENNNMIDLNAYALGLDAMYEALVLYDVIQRSEQLNCDHEWKVEAFDCYVMPYERYCEHCGKKEAI